MTEAILGQLASTGVVGALLVLALLALRDKDRQLKAEMLARIEDAKKYNDMSMALQREVMAAVDQLGRMIEMIERREAERDAAREATRNKGGPYR